MRELALHILDLAENSLAAGASRVSIEVDERLADDRLIITVSDDGRGMEPEMVAHVTDPFVTTRTTRRVGLGLSLLQAAAERCGGGLTIESQPGVGTTVRAEFQHSHIDRAPLGDVAATLVSLIVGGPQVDYRYVHRRNGQQFVFDTADVRAELEDVPITEPSVLDFIRQYIQEGLEVLK